VPEAVFAIEISDRFQRQCPVVKLLLNDLGTKPVGGSLQRRDIVDG
jgi:hypothetical protein